MLAAVLHAPGDVRVEEVAAPAPREGHALVRVGAVGVCGSDVPRMLSTGAHRLPLVCGHEFGGVVESVAGLDLAPGTRVTVPPLIPCLDCPQCRAGHLSLCRDYGYFGSREDGAYAELVSVPATNLLPVPDAVDDVAAASVDPAAIALHAIWRAGGITAGQRVAVVGAGPIGLFAVQWAGILGAGAVVAVDVTDEKLALARELGADEALAPADADALAGHFDVVVDTAGAPPAERQAIRLAGPRGHVVLVGIPTEAVALDRASFQHLLREEIDLHGAWNSFSAPFPGPEWTVSVDAMASGRLRTAEIVSHREPLAALPERLAWMGQGRGFYSKVMFFPNG